MHVLTANLVVPGEKVMREKEIAQSHPIKCSASETKSHKPKLMNGKCTEIAGKNNNVMF